MSTGQRTLAGMASCTPKQALFAREYIKDCNATKAAERAGYAAKTARQQGSRLLSHAAVSQLIAKLTAEKAEKLELKAEDVLREIMRLAFVDIGKAYDEEGRFRPLHEIPEDVRRAIAGIETEELWRDEFAGQGRNRVNLGTITKVKFWSKPESLRDLAKHLGLLKDKLELGGEGGGPVEISITRTVRK